MPSPELLCASAADIEATSIQLRARMTATGLCYGDAPVPTTAAAVVFDGGHWARLVVDVRRLFDALREQLGDRLAPLMRLDAVLDSGGRLRVLEINTLFSGLASSDGLAELIIELVDMRGARPKPLVSHLAHRLSATGNRVALLGRPIGDAVWGEYRYTLACLARTGCIDPVGAPVAALATDSQGYLTVGPVRVDAIYVRGTLEDWNRPAVHRALSRSRAVVVNPLDTLASGDKSVLAEVSEAAAQGVLSSVGVVAIEAHLPRTLHAHTAQAQHQLAADRGRWVLKPRLGWGGRDVLLGAYTEAATWREACTRACAGGWIAQEFVPQHRVPDTVPIIAGHYLNLGLVVLDGELLGGFGRVAPAPVVNIAQAGAMLPLLVREEEVVR